MENALVDIIATALLCGVGYILAAAAVITLSILLLW